MSKVISNTIKSTSINLVISVIIAAVLMGVVYLIFGNDISSAISYVNMITIDTENREIKEAILTEEKTIQNIPEYGSKYATLEIPAIDRTLPVYFGDTLDVLKHGVGHSSGSYFPGEGGSIIYMGHNSQDVFRKFSELKKGDEITIKTDYGEFKYHVYDMQIVKETELEKLPVQHEEEILMMYTCYPFTYLGHTTQRYVVYAK